MRVLASSINPGGQGNLGDSPKYYEADALAIKAQAGWTGFKQINAQYEGYDLSVVVGDSNSGSQLGPNDYAALPCPRYCTSLGNLLTFQQLQNL